MTAKRLGMMAALGIGLLVRAAVAQVGAKEDLSESAMPTGEVVLPLPGTMEADNGTIFRLSDKRFNLMPMPAPGKAPPGDQELLAQLRKDHVGDLLYTRQGGGSLLVVSGRATALGSMLLQDVSGKDLAPPKAPAADAAPAVPGLIAGIKDGELYLIETTDARFALVRVLRKEPGGLRIQYVFQPSGASRFTVPQKPPVALMPLPAATTNPAATAPAATAPGAGTTPVSPGGETPTTLPALPGEVPTTNAAGSPAAMPPGVTPAVPDTPRPLRLGPTAGPTVLEPFMSTHLQHRKMIIERRVAIMNNPARMPKDIVVKTEAIEDLGRLRAEEAVKPLLADICFLNPEGKRRQFSMEAYHPAVAALIEIGKPASRAALQAIGEIRPMPAEQAGKVDPLQSPEYRLRLLALVVRGVEGTDAAEFLLQQEAGKSEGVRRSDYEQAIKYIREP